MNASGHRRRRRPAVGPTLTEGPFVLMDLDGRLAPPHPPAALPPEQTRSGGNSGVQQTKMNLAAPAASNPHDACAYGNRPLVLMDARSTSDDCLPIPALGGNATAQREIGKVGLRFERSD